MNNNFSSLLLVVVATLSCMFATDSRAAVVIDFVLSAPGVQQSALQGQTGSVTENFNSFSTGLLPGTGTLAVGSYTSTGIAIFNADAWGGAGGTGRCPSTTANNKTLSITLTPSKYVGFWWSAGNPNNDVNIYGTGNVLLGSFDSEVIPRAHRSQVVAQKCRGG